MKIETKRNLQELGVFALITLWLVLTVIGGVVVGGTIMEKCPAPPPPMTETELREKILERGNTKVCLEVEGYNHCVKLIKLKEKPSR